MLNGLINIYKEPGFTSHDVVEKLRGIIKQKQIGHTGTLDPNAEGVLLVCLGKATKLFDMLVGDTKTYEVVLLLGVTTDTQDVGGNIRERRPVFCTEEDVRRCLKTFLGEQHQIPPMYSALKQNGKKLYEMAREGKEVERVARPVHFYEITVMKIDLPRVWLRATCSKGTYIRTFCHDIGEALGCGGCMEHLIRTKVGTFEWKNTFKLHQVKFLADQGRLEDCILPIDKMFNSLPALQVEPQGNKLAWNGGYLYPQQIRGSENPPNWTDGSDYRVYDSKRVFVGIYRYEAKKSYFRLIKMFYDGKAG